MKTVNCAAVDLGATSGRIIVGSWSDNQHVSLSEVHRFPNTFHTLGQNDYWDIGGIWREILHGLSAAKRRFPKLASVGICTWGCDHVLVTGRGRIAFPVHAYRDQRTQTGMRRLSSSPRKLWQVYSETGIPAQFYNTSLQLEETLEVFPDATESVGRCLFLPDYFNYLLSGRMENEISIASTSQLLSVTKLDWSRETLRTFGISPDWFSRPITAGTKLGIIKRPECLAGIDVIAVPGHDTACAFDAMPAANESSDLYINSGTWSLVGCERISPLVSRAGLRAGICNERTGSGAFRPLKSVTGLWLLERFLNESGWKANEPSNWTTLIHEAEERSKAKALLDTNDPAFNHPANMRQAIDRFIQRRGARPPTDRAGYTRLILDSLASGHARAHGVFRELGDQKFDRIVLVGGGARNSVLCQSTADQAGIKVAAYSLEASALGNLGCQFVAMGAISSRLAFRQALSRQFKPQTYLPYSA